jgi:3-hydroxyacyl-[acyl-carrier-protein] dehydratase
MNLPIPQRPPFLFVDRVLEQGENEITAEKYLPPSEAFFQGHFPQYPLMPGVLLLEAMLQTGSLLIAGGNQTETKAEDKIETTNKFGVVTRIKNAKFKNMAYPGDTLTIKVKSEEKLGDTYYMSGEVSARGLKLASAQFACSLVELDLGPNPNRDAIPIDVDHSNENQGTLHGA